MYNIEFIDNKFYANQVEFNAPSENWHKILSVEYKRFLFINYKFRVTYEPSILFPFIDFLGRISGFYIRSTVSKSTHHHYLGAMPFATSKTPNKGVLLVVEGLADLLSIHDITPFTAASMSNGLTSYQCDWIYILYKFGFITRVVMIRDNDHRSDKRSPGLTGALASKSKLDKLSVPFIHYTTPFGAKDPGELYGSNEFRRLVTAWTR